MSCPNMQRCFGLLSCAPEFLLGAVQLEKPQSMVQTTGFRVCAECCDYELNTSMNVMWGDSKVESDLHCSTHKQGFPGDSDSKESACNAGDPDSIPGLGRSPGERNDYSLQYYCLENSMDRGTWLATVHVAAKI